MKNGGWLKVLTVVISIVVMIAPILGYIIHQQDEIKDCQRDMQTDMTILKERLAWSGVIPVKTRSLITTKDWLDLADHIRERNEAEKRKNGGS